MKPSPKGKKGPAAAEKCAYLTSCASQDHPHDAHTPRDFLAHMNHDLRTPLNAVIGFAQIIESEMYGKIGPQYLEYARHIQDSGYDLLTKIEDLVRVAEGEKPAPPPRKRRQAPRLVRARELAVAE